MALGERAGHHCGQPLGNRGCEKDAAATEALFLKNFSGYDYIVAPRGITVVETDLGERIQQLDHQRPAHIVVPAVHKLASDVSRVFSKTLQRM
ncbi:Lactate utilization protein B [Paraburkholderia ultramafica]|uniref:Lactate utilization protein B n=1 Tax=Paraburkholderia ultramafica TaxID=1544867 RepID=A0A6S7BQ39_9BURK|nr:Lactate utilization protein B [Paraburkholderia ultramafica]